MTLTAKCPHCGNPIECEVIPGDHFVDLPDACEICGHKFSPQETATLYDRLLADANDHVIDRAEYLRED